MILTVASWFAFVLFFYTQIASGLRFDVDDGSLHMTDDDTMDGEDIGMDGDDTCIRGLEV